MSVLLCHKRKKVRYYWAGAFHHCISTARTYLSSVKELDQALFVGSFHLFDLLAVLIYLKRGIAFDSSGFRAPFIGVTIHLLEDELGVVGDVAYKNGSDMLAGWAPGRKEVDN